MTINTYVATKRPQKIQLYAFDPTKKDTHYLNIGGWVKDKSPDGLYRRKFEIYLPQSPENLNLAVFNRAAGNKKNDPSFKVEKFGVEKLKKWNIWTKPHTNRAVRFFQMFSENAGVLRAQRQGESDEIGNYASDDGKVRIKYVDIIRSKETGKPMTTPARISNKTGIIEVAKYYFRNYSVQMRMMILLHEYSHYWLNDDIRNEIKADLNGLYVYLGNGYSPIEAHRAFLYVFSNYDTPQNQVRYKMIQKYIYDFMSGGIATPQNHSGKLIRQAA